jgi:TRAP-type C4-dicarboxylate transport system permease large subunit
MRLAFGVAAGVVAQFLFAADYVDGILIGILFYLVSFYAARYAWYRGLDQKLISKLYTTGIGGYVMTYLFVYILLFTIYST